MAANNDDPRHTPSSANTRDDLIKGAVDHVGELGDEALGDVAGGLGDIVITKVVDKSSPKL